MKADESLLPESVKRAHKEIAERKASHARISRINHAANELRSYVPADEQEDFFTQFSRRILTLGKVLKSENIAQHLGSIESGFTNNELQHDAFKYAVSIFRAAVAGDRKTVRKMLVLAYETTEADGLFRNGVYEALRRGIIPKLMKQEFPYTQKPCQVSKKNEQIEELSVTTVSRETDYIYVTSDVAAALVNRSKSSLLKRKGLPKPDVKGGRGQPNEWLWSKLRPWLESKYSRPLPEIPPGSRIHKN